MPRTSLLKRLCQRYIHHYMAVVARFTIERDLLCWQDHGAWEASHRGSVDGMRRGGGSDDTSLTVAVAPLTRWCVCVEGGGRQVAQRGSDLTATREGGVGDRCVAGLRFMGLSDSKLQANKGKTDCRHIYGETSTTYIISFLFRGPSLSNNFLPVSQCVQTDVMRHPWESIFSPISHKYVWSDQFVCALCTHVNWAAMLTLIPLTNVYYYCCIYKGSGDANMYNIESRVENVWRFTFKW